MARDLTPNGGPHHFRFKTPLVCLTAYTTPMVRLADAHCEVVLVGDSVGMVLHGLPPTLGVTMEMMLLHGQAVRRGLDRALMVVGMPFGSYEQTVSERLHFISVPIPAVDPVTRTGS